MAERLPENNRDIPRIIIAERVIENIVRGALLYPEPETGEAMIGLVVPQAGHQEPDVYVLDTISPGERAVRQWGMFEQGSDWQADVFNWLYWNWEGFRELRRPSYGSALAAKWDVPLSHVGDWHKQPGSMTEPSPGDVQTARHMLVDAETPVEHLVAPIVTMYRLKDDLDQDDVDAAPGDGESVQEAAKTGDSAAPEVLEETTDGDSPNFRSLAKEKSVEAEPPPDSPNTIVKTLPDEGWRIRIDFWYMSKRTRGFLAVTPVVWPDSRLPSLPPVAWHLAHPHRFDQEYDLLAQAGYQIDVVRWDADGKPPYEICFSVYEPGSSHVILLVTPVDYPVEMPAIRTAPIMRVSEDEDLFEKLYDASEPILMTQMPAWQWDSKRTLIELVWHVEKTVFGRTGV